MELLSRFLKVTVDIEDLLDPIRDIIPYLLIKEFDRGLKFFED